MGLKDLDVLLCHILYLFLIPLGHVEDQCLYILNMFYPVKIKLLSLLNNGRRNRDTNNNKETETTVSGKGTETMTETETTVSGEGTETTTERQGRTGE